MPTAEGNVGVAFALVCGAGASTAIGAAVVFFPSLVKLASRRVLAASLGVSAGVMTYVSFVEIFVKSVIGFRASMVTDDMTDDEVLESENRAFVYASASFFGGVVVMIIVDFLVKCLSGEHHRHHVDDPATMSNIEATDKDKCDDEEEEFVVPHCVGCCDDPVGELNKWQQRATEELQYKDGTDTKTSDSLIANETGTNSSDNDGRNIPRDHDSDLSNSDGNHCGSNCDSFKENEGPTDETGNTVVVENAPMSADREQKKLMTMGLSTAVAIGLHNFPEGLATFVSALADTSVGAVFAVAIGIHNIPEGLCVALPIYYATGNRWKAFMWGCLSGLSEPVAALLGWLILADAMSDVVYAILFGIVSGMMVIISLKELIPTAHRYDPEDTVVTFSLIFGMAVIALSLVMFRL